MGYLSSFSLNTVQYLELASLRFGLLSSKPGTPDKMFHIFMAYISHVHLETALMRTNVVHF